MVSLALFIFEQLRVAQKPNGRTVKLDVAIVPSHQLVDHAAVEHRVRLDVSELLNRLVLQSLNRVDQSTSDGSLSSIDLFESFFISGSPRPGIEALGGLHCRPFDLIELVLTHPQAWDMLLSEQ